MSYDKRGREHGGGSVRSADAAIPSKIGGNTLIQARGDLHAPKVGGGALTDGDIHEAASAGVAGPGGALPHGDAIQRSFGRHDISGIQSHVGGAAENASRAIGAEAYATGNSVAFAGAPSLHTAAHEAAHVVQQRGGVQLKGGVGASGDAHEQHADAVADAVVQGRSAESLLDRYAGGGGGSAAVQRKDGDPPAPAPTALSPEVTAVMAKLEKVLLPMFFGIIDGTFDIAGVTRWMDGFLALLDEVKTAGGANPPAELIQAVDHCVGLTVSDLGDVGNEIRTATVQLTNDSSVSKKDPSKAVFPSQASVKKFGDDAGKLNQLARDTTLPAGPTAKTTLQTAAAKVQDAALAMLQSLSVVAARERWKTGTSTQTPSAANAGKGARTELDEIFKDGGWSDRVNNETAKDGSQHVYDWCGMFVASSYFKGAGLASQLRGGFWHTDNVAEFFNYTQKVNPGRVPMSIWAEGQWWNLRAYHEQRNSPRMWTPRATVAAALAAGGADIRPGDTCLIDHSGGNKPGHIVMVESYDPVTRQMVTIEGNTFGIHADASGKAERVDDAHLKDSTQGSGTATGLHVRDMRTLAPGPGAYWVNNANAYVRDPDDISKYKLVDKKKVAIPNGSKVNVTEVKDVAGDKYGNVENWGWTKLSNLDMSETPPAGGYKAKSGATVFGVGRPSLVDFEDGHDYAVNQVPAELNKTSPADMRELAKKGTAAGLKAKAVDMK